MARVDLVAQQFSVQAIEYKVDLNTGTWTTSVDLEQLVVTNIPGYVVDDFKWPVLGYAARTRTLVLLAEARVRVVDGEVRPNPNNPFSWYSRVEDQIGVARDVGCAESRLAGVMGQRAIVSMVSRDNGLSWSGWNVVLWAGGFGPYFDGSPGSGGGFGWVHAAPFKDGFIFAFLAGANAYQMYTEDGETWSKKRYLFNVNTAYEGITQPGIGADAYWTYLTIDSDGDGKRDAILTTYGQSYGRFTGGSGYHHWGRFSFDEGLTWSPWRWYWSDHCGVTLYGGCSGVVGRGNKLPLSYGSIIGECKHGGWWSYARSSWEVGQSQWFGGYGDFGPSRSYVTHTYDEGAKRWSATLGAFCNGWFSSDGDMNCMANLRGGPYDCWHAVTWNEKWDGNYLLIFEKAFSTDATAHGQIQADTIVPNYQTWPVACMRADAVEGGPRGFTIASEPVSRSVHYKCANGYFYMPYGPVRGLARIDLSQRHPTTSTVCGSGTGRFNAELYPIPDFRWHPDYFTSSELTNVKAGCAGTMYNVREGVGGPFAAANFDNDFFFHERNHPDLYYTSAKFRTEAGEITLGLCKTVVWARSFDDENGFNFEGFFGWNYYESYRKVDP